MSAPVPLTDPAGLVRAYTCGRCGHTHDGSASRMGISADEVPTWIERQREYSLRDAERCCTCGRCGGPLEGGWRHGTCAACGPAEEAEQAAQAAASAKIGEERRRVYEAHLAKALDPDAAERLREIIRDLSEEHWCAGWLIDCEFTLWRMVAAGEGQEWGFEVVEAKRVAEMGRLSTKAGGWWHWLDDQGEVFVPMAEWLAIVAKAVAS